MNPKIVRFTDESEKDSSERAFEEADIVIDEEDYVIKDRHGVVPRRATKAERLAAELV